jgi:large subunit ribosomal protein L10
VPTAAKVTAVDDLKTRLQGVSSVFLAEYRGLTVQQLSELRRQLRAVSAEYKVVKNRLARLAVSSSDLAAIAPHLTGPTGFIIARDEPVAVAKTLQAFTRTVPTLALKAGIVEGQMLGPDELKALADLPSKAVLRSQLVGAIQGPLAQLAGLLERVQRDLVYILEQRGERAAQES